MITISLSNQSHVDTKIELSRIHACRNAAKFSIIPVHIHENVSLCRNIEHTTIHYWNSYCIGLNVSEAFVESTKYCQCIRVNTFPHNNKFGDY